MRALWSHRLFRDGVIYSALFFCAALIPLAFHPDSWPRNPTNLAIAAIAVLTGGFALSTVIWFVDRRLPELTGGSALKKQIATLVGWLAVAAAMVLAFTLMSSR